ncbi:MAG: hypothetical protein ACUVXI_17155 [bacterium]
MAEVRIDEEKLQEMIDRAVEKRIIAVRGPEYGEYKETTAGKVIELSGKMDTLTVVVERMEKSLDELNERMERGLRELNEKMERSLGELKGEIRELRKSAVPKGWFIAFSSMTITFIVGLAALIGVLITRI